MSDLFGALLDKDKPMETISDHGLARTTDPSTSHAAAKEVNATKGERIVLETLATHGPMTMEEMGAIHGKPSDHLGPRFASLKDKRMVALVRSADGTIKTKAGNSGRQRQIYQLQLDQSLWRSRPKKMSTKARVEDLETGLRNLRKAATTGGASWIVGRIDKILEN